MLAGLKKKILVQLTFAYVSINTNFTNMMILTFVNFKKLKATFNGFFFSYPWACLTMPIQITSIWKKNVKNSQKWGFSHVIVWKNFIGNLSTKTLSTKFLKNETFHLYVSGDNFSWTFSLKNIRYKLDKHQAFFMYVSWNI